VIHVPQSERMRAALEEARRRHARALLAAVERAASGRLRAAEAELEDKARQAGAECQAWMSVAQSHEAVTAGLRGTLEQLVLRPPARPRPWACAAPERGVAPFCIRRARPRRPEAGGRGRGGRRRAGRWRCGARASGARLGGPADGRETGEVDPRRREELERAPLLRAAHSSALAAGEIGFPFAFASVLLEIGFLPTSCIPCSREANSICLSKMHIDC